MVQEEQRSAYSAAADTSYTTREQQSQHSLGGYFRLLLAPDEELDNLCSSNQLEGTFNSSSCCKGTAEIFSNSCRHSSLLLLH